MVLRLNLINVREIYFMIVYRPPSGDVKNFINNLEDVIPLLSRKNNIEINLGGDINLNSRKTRDRNVKLYKEFLRRQNLVNVIKLDTCHVLNRDSSAIDHFCTNNKDL